MTKDTIKMNLPLLYWIQKQINECPVGEACSGDSGEVHCILCVHNVLSTDELKGTVWNTCPHDLENNDLCRELGKNPINDQYISVKDKR